MHGILFRFDFASPPTPAPTPPGVKRVARGRGGHGLSATRRLCLKIGFFVWVYHSLQDQKKDVTKNVKPKPK